MLLVRTTVRPSLIHGRGLFAAVPIPRGTPVWAYDDGIDRLLTTAPWADIEPYCWREADAWVLPGDDARFMNHSFTPNVRSGGSRFAPDVAAQDIGVGEELTIDYTTFDLDAPAYRDRLR